MRRPAVFLLTLLLAGCSGPLPPNPTGTGPTGEPTGEPEIAECRAEANATAHATPVSNVPTRNVPRQFIDVLALHRDSVALYHTDGSEEIAASPIRMAVLPFSDDLGYRFVSDGSAVHDDSTLHRLGTDLKTTATWNATRLGGVVHHGTNYYAAADGKLHVLTDQLAPVMSLEIANWTAPAVARYDVVYAEQDLLLIGTAGRPDHLLAYQILDRAKPQLLKEIPVPHSSVPVGDANLPASPTDSTARKTPWTDVHSSHIVATPHQFFLWRDGAYQGNPYQTVSRFQDFVSVWRSNLTVEHLQQQYLEDNHYGHTQGAHVGPVDHDATWSLLHIEGTFSLAALVHTSGRVLPACHVDVKMSSFAPEDAFFHRGGMKILLGTQARIDAWDVSGEPGKIAEAELARPATDARWA